MNISQIKSDIDFYCGSTSATYSDTNKIRNVNFAYQAVASLIWESAADWQYDDSNATTLPVAKTTLVHNQQDYSLPSTTQRVHRIEIKDNSGNWMKLQPLDMHDIPFQAMPEYQKTPGFPIYYDLVGRSIVLYPIPVSSSVTLASGLAVYVDRDVTEFPVTASSTTPGFPPAFHKILSLAASIDFTQDNVQRQFLVQMKDRLEKGLSRFYSKRMVEKESRLTPRGKKLWRQYL